MGDVVKEMKGAEGVVVVGEGAVAVSGLRGVASARRRQGPRLPPLTTGMGEYQGLGYRLGMPWNCYISN